MKLRPNGFKKASKRGPIDLIRGILDKNRSPSQDLKCCVRKPEAELGNSHHGLAVVPTTTHSGLPQLARGGCHDCGSFRFPKLARLSLRPFGFHSISSVLCCNFIFKGLILVASGGYISITILEFLKKLHRRPQMRD